MPSGNETDITELLQPSDQGHGQSSRLKDIEISVQNTAVLAAFLVHIQLDQQIKCPCAAERAWACDRQTVRRLHSSRDLRSWVQTDRSRCCRGRPGTDPPALPCGISDYRSRERIDGELTTVRILIVFHFRRFIVDKFYRQLIIYFKPEILCLERGWRKRKI